MGPGNQPALQQEIASLRENVAGLEKERDFYFLKLRDIELLLQRAVEADPELEKEDDGLIKQIQNILYSTEVSSQVGRRSSSGLWLTSMIPPSGGI